MGGIVKLGVPELTQRMVGEVSGGLESYEESAAENAVLIRMQLQAGLPSVIDKLIRFVEGGNRMDRDQVTAALALLGFELGVRGGSGRGSGSFGIEAALARAERFVDGTERKSAVKIKAR